MRRFVLVVTASFLALATPASSEEVRREQSTVLGWFSCDRCAPAARVRAKHISPSNRDCVKKCVAEGAGLVFLDEKARAVLRVTNPGAAKGQESHYVQVTGVIDAEEKTLTVSSIKVLKEFVAKCASGAETTQ